MRTYLDWNATTPLRPEVKAAITEALELVKACNGFDKIKEHSGISPVCRG